MDIVTERSLLYVHTQTQSEHGKAGANINAEKEVKIHLDELNDYSVMSLKLKIDSKKYIVLVIMHAHGYLRILCRNTDAFF